MVNVNFTSLLKRQEGSSMIEVLVTLVIVSFGLLGLAGLQTRLQTSEMESYQRSQALLLLGDMANRISVNRGNAAAYVALATVDNPLGVGMTCSNITSTNPFVQTDLREWCDGLQGAAETTGGNKVGAMIGGRGCIENLVANEYLVTVAWQGMAPLSAPPSTVTCGQGEYDSAACTGDRCRRAITTVVRIGTLL
jgi:type IV pilus assembly protein PilV